MHNPKLLARLLMPAIVLLAGVATAADGGDGLRLQNVSDQVYAIVGPFGNLTPDNLDQSRFAYLEDYETLKGHNAQQVFQEMEWE